MASEMSLKDRVLDYIQTYGQEDTPIIAEALGASSEEVSSIINNLAFEHAY